MGADRHGGGRDVAGTTTLTDRAASWLLIGGRLKPGMSVSQAAAEMDVIGRTLEREYPEQNRDAGLRLLALSPVPGNGGPIVAFLALLMVIVSFVLIVACANVAGVLLARAAARRQEMALRLAIGAGRARLVRQLLTETVLLFMLGGIAGLAAGPRDDVAAGLPAADAAVSGRSVAHARRPRDRVYRGTVAGRGARCPDSRPRFSASNADVLPGLRRRRRARRPAAPASRVRHRPGGVEHRARHRAPACSCARCIGPRRSIRVSIRTASSSRRSTWRRRATPTATGPPFARALVDRVRAAPRRANRDDRHVAAGRLRGRA